MLQSPLHENHLLRYSVVIEDKPMLKHEKTALISFFDENNKRVSVIKYSVVNKEEVYDLIEKGQDINLNNSYIKDFSINEYRVDKGLDDHVIIKLKNFSAKKAFFDCEISTDFSYTEFEGEKIVFESAIFGNGYNNFLSADFGHGDVNFKKSKFGSGSTTFQSVKFGEGNISFNNTNFGSGNISFADVDFGKGDVDFKSTYFGDGNVDFKFARFSAGDISFERASFGKGKIDFKNADFGGGKIDFRRVDFNDGDVLFDGVDFGDGKVTFRSAKFGQGHKSFEQSDFADGEVQFDLVDFGSGTVSFNHSKVFEISFKSCPLNCFMDLRFNKCELLDLSNTIVRDILDIIPETEKVKIKEMNLVGMRILGRIFIDWRANQVFDLIYNQKNTSLFQKAEQFRILKENFRNNGQYEDEDNSYVEFKRCEAKANLNKDSNSKLKRIFIKYPTYYFQQYIFDFVGRYATNSTRVLANMVVTFFSFSVVYFVFSEWFNDIGHVVAGGSETIALNDHSINIFESFGNSLYYSGITFFTIGYGDYFAWGILKPIAVFEGFSGVFLMSYFTVAFVRKILR